MYSDLSPGEMYAIYDTATGQIRSSFLFPMLLTEVQEVVDIGHALYQGPAVDVRNYYVTGGAMTPRPAMAPQWQDGKSQIASDSVDSCTLTAIPQGSQIQIDGATLTMDSGVSISFTASTPGTHQVYLRRWPYFDWIGSFTAVVPQA